MAFPRMKTKGGLTRKRDRVCKYSRESVRATAMDGWIWKGSLDITARIRKISKIRKIVGFFKRFWLLLMSLIRFGFSSLIWMTLRDFISSNFVSFFRGKKKKNFFLLFAKEIISPKLKFIFGFGYLFTYFLYFFLKF